MKDLKVHLGVALIEVNDPVLLAEIENDGALRAVIGERLSDYCIVVQPAAVQEVVKRLRALGHMPRLIGEENRAGREHGGQ